MLVNILTGPVVNWTMFVTECQRVLGHSPTRILDCLGIKTESPLALLLTIPVSNKEQKASLSILKESKLDHYYLTMLMTCEKHEYPANLAEVTQLRVHHVEGDDECVAFITGSMKDWIETIIIMERDDKQVKNFKTLALQQLKMLDYYEVLNG
jgi:hypothetical protein